MLIGMNLIDFNSNSVLSMFQMLPHPVVLMYAIILSCYLIPWPPALHLFHPCQVMTYIKWLDRPQVRIVFWFLQWIIDFFLHIMMLPDIVQLVVC